MRTYIALFFICQFLSPFAFGSESISELRKKFYEVSEERITIAEYINYMNQLSIEKDSPKMAYKSMIYMLQSKESWNPFKKYSYFNKGKVILEDVIESNKNNLELRFLRLCIQINIPKFLNYDHMNEDIRFIRKKIFSISDLDLKQRIILFFKEHQIQISSNNSSSL